MRFLTGILAAVILIGGSALAQTPATSAPKTPAPAHQPGTPAQPPAASAAPSASEAPPALEKPDPAKEAAIRHLMDLTQTSKLGDNIANYISGRFVP